MMSGKQSNPVFLLSNVKKKGSVPLLLQSVTFTTALTVKKKIFYRSKSLLNENFSVFQTSSGSTVTRVGKQFKTL